MSEHAQDHMEVPKDTHGEGNELPLPQSHLEALHFAGVTEGKMHDFGRTVYHNEALFGAGLHKEWTQLTAGENSEEAFGQAYTKYVDQPGQLQQERPDWFNFLKTHVFVGKDYLSAPQQERPRFGYDSGPKYYEGMHGTVYRSDDGGSKWRKVN
jgi:hypothetical protein